MQNTMKKTLSLTNFLIIITTIHNHMCLINTQQSYINNDQLDCNVNEPVTDGFVCNRTKPFCTSYITFRTIPPYNTPPNIAYLLNSTTSDISQLNNVSDVDIIPSDRLIVVPVTCTCTRPRANGRRYYQHNANYTLKAQGETYFTMANNTYQGLSTCQAMMNQNSRKASNLTVKETVVVPIMCACPTKEQQENFDAMFLVSYIVTWGDTISSIAKMFSVSEKSVLNANELQSNEIIYPFTPVLVPVSSESVILKFVSTVTAPSTQLNSSVPRVGPVGRRVKRSDNTGFFVGVGIGAAVLLIALISFLAWFFLIRSSGKKGVSVVKIDETSDQKDPENASASAKYRSLPGSFSSNSQTTKSSSMDLDGFKYAIGSLTAYKFTEIEKGMANFGDGNRIKGSMYRGEFNGEKAAVKIIKGNISHNEINILKRINHNNIIRLLGYCIHEGNTWLVYEYAENGSVDDLLSQIVLSWKQRVQIACNVADALNYLHSYINPPYIHKNLKSSNVLLDASYKAKIANFGLARRIKEEDGNGVIHLTKHVVGTQGYLAPEYIENGVVTPKLDVFAFGVVVLELLSGKPAVRPSGTKRGGDDLLHVAIKKVFEGVNAKDELTEFMDSNLRKEYPLDLAYSLAQLANKCVDGHMNSRPSMAEVSMTLSKIYSSSLDWDPSDDLRNSSSKSRSNSA